MPLDHNLVKTWFVSRAKPFATHFFQWIDACWFKGEKFGMEDLNEELATIINSNTRTVILPVGVFQYIAKAGTLIERFVIAERPTIHIGAVFIYTVRIGLTPSGDEIFEDTEVDIADADSGILTKAKYFVVDTVIYFTITPTAGEPNNPLIKIYKS